MLLELRYNSYDLCNSVKLHHAIFGELNHQSHCGKKYIYYRPGILHDVLFTKIKNCHYVIDTEKKDIDFTQLSKYGTVTVHTVDTEEIKDKEFITAEEHWRRHATKWKKKVKWAKRKNEISSKTE